MDSTRVIQVHSTLLRRDCTHYEKRLIQSVYYSAWGEALIAMERVLGRPLTVEEIKIFLDKSE